MNQKQAKQEVSQLRKALPLPNERQTKWMNARSIRHYIYYTSPKKCWCSHCGKEFSVDAITENCTCPNCGERYEMKKSGKKNHNEIAYSAILTTRGDWQVVRYFLTECYSYKESAKRWYAISYYNYEVMCKWYNPTEKVMITERRKLGMFPNYRKIPYSLDSRLYFPKTNWAGSPYGDNFNEEWFLKKIYPNAMILPYFRKRGLNNKSAEIVCLDKYMEKVDSEPFVETLVKTGQYRLANALLYENRLFDRYTPQVKIALRNGFDFEQLKRLGDYEDYLRDLEELGLDIHSPKYLCPADFYKEHSRMSERVRRKREIEEEKRRREGAKRFSKELAERTKPYADLVIEGFGLMIRVLTTPDQYIDEGKAMHHCVGSYVDRAFHDTSIIFSARDMNGKRVETIEIDTKKWVIVQSRAVCNGTSEHHNDIINLMKKNMPKLKRLAQAS